MRLKWQDALYMPHREREYLLAQSRLMIISLNRAGLYKSDQAVKAVVVGMLGGFRTVLQKNRVRSQEPDPDATYLRTDPLLFHDKECEYLMAKFQQMVDSVNTTDLLGESLRAWIVQWLRRLRNTLGQKRFKVENTTQEMPEVSGQQPLSLE